MSDVLGYDIHGRPLRVGDEVVVVLPSHPDINAAGQVVKADCVCGRSYIYVDWRYGMVTRGWPGEYLRKLTDDHRPADESFHEMLRKFNKEGAPT